MMRQMQRLGRALMGAVAVMPVAALMLGIGYWIDPSGWGANNVIAMILIKSGGAVLDNLGIIFAVAVAYGLSKDKDGASALAGMIGFILVTNVLSAGAVSKMKGLDLADEAVAADFAKQGFDKINSGNVFVGIIIGIIAAAIYNRFHDKKLPDALAFFSGRRMVPIITSFAALVLSGVLYFVWPVVYSGLVAFGTTVASMGPLGAAIHAFFNRLLIPTGLHHALNNVFWFDLIKINDIGNFWNIGQPDVVANVERLVAETGGAYVPGMYQAGFFPIMMFGLPGAALAMYHTAKTERKKEAASLLLAGAVASFVTGVTEPIEFAFMFLAPSLYIIHAVLTGISAFIAASLKWMSGFSFSAGMIDMILAAKLPTATKWYMLLLLGVVFFVIYYVVFRFIITKFDLKTPGRGDDADADEQKIELGADTDFAVMAAQILEGLGGKDNIAELDYCVTRLRMGVKDNLLVNEELIKRAPISGVIRPSKTSVQVIVGPQVQFVADEMRKLL